MTVSIVSSLKAESFECLDGLLNDSKHPLHERFRALFTLKNLACDQSVAIVAKGFSDDSALFKHEIAYVLGQMKNPTALPFLQKALEDLKEDSMVRHEAAEAMGAIGSIESLPILEKFMESDKEIVVRQTCELAVAKIKNEEEKKRTLGSSVTTTATSSSSFASIDPAPPLETSHSIDELGEILMNSSLPLFVRYQAMFSLRNASTTEAVLALAKGFEDESALFRHEIAYVYGQMQHPESVPFLQQVLANEQEISMVRHECAEALGSVATPECYPILAKYAKDPERVVRESCIVALDMYEHENSGEFQYANGLAK